MELADIVRRACPPAPWAEGDKIPWDDPAFSRRMLAEHLSQEHELASRRAPVIEAQVDWIDRTLLHGRPSRVLDLGCGPGLYTQRLAGRGHACHGVDFSPASVEYARARAAEEGADCRYTLADVRAADYGDGYDLAMFLFGELNVFRPADAHSILAKCRAALRPGGALLLEVSTFDAVRRLGAQPRTWRSAERGLFSDRPHLLLHEGFWDEGLAVATERWYVVNCESGQVASHAASTQAYTEDDYRALIDGAGFRDVTIYPCLGVAAAGQEDSFLAVVARTPS